jgi:hypothetical protein
MVVLVLNDRGFIITDKEKDTISKRLNNGRRYFFLVAKRKEGGEIVERFIKIPENNTKKLLLPFVRQIEMAKYLKVNNIISTRGVIESNIDTKSGTPFVIMETFPQNQDKIGFIENNNGVEFLTEREAKSTIEQLIRFHHINILNLPLKLQQILVNHKNDYKSLKRDINKFLNKKVRPNDFNSSELFHKVLEKRLGIQDLKKKVSKLLNEWQSVIESQGKSGLYLVHGDMAPNNLYIFDSGEVEFLDLEWVGQFRNSALAMIVDFGNLRARSWKSSNFRRELDKVLISQYEKEGNKELGQIIVNLSILRSHIMLSSYFENYDWAKQELVDENIRRKETEADIKLVLE